MLLQLWLWVISHYYDPNYRAIRSHESLTHSPLHHVSHLSGFGCWACVQGFYSWGSIISVGKHSWVWNAPEYCAWATIVQIFPDTTVICVFPWFRRYPNINPVKMFAGLECFRDTFVFLILLFCPHRDQFCSLLSNSDNWVWVPAGGKNLEADFGVFV